jgi:hypothetical protein
MRAGMMLKTAAEWRLCTRAENKEVLKRISREGRGRERSELGSNWRKKKI